MTAKRLPCKGCARERKTWSRHRDAVLLAQDPDGHFCSMHCAGIYGIRMAYEEQRSGVERLQSAVISCWVNPEPNYGKELT